MKKTDKLRLEHILDAIHRIHHHLKGKSAAEFRQSEILFDAITKQLIIIGEAASHLSEETRNQNPDMPIHLMVGMRNRLIHEYFNISPEIVWKTCATDIKELEKTIKDLV